MERDAFYEDMLRPLLFSIEPEDAHELAHHLVRMFNWALQKMPYTYTGSDLRVTIGNTTFPNPVGLAAGFDKNGTLLDVIGAVGFGFVEVGSVTAKSSAGNPQPRLFRLPEDKALINRMGLNGQGADTISRRLKSCRPSAPFGINIAKTNDPAITGDKAIEDILYSFKNLKDIDCAYIALNASCPNTSEGCMKESRDLDVIFTEMQKTNSRQLPIFVKLSPDSPDQLLKDIVDLAKRHRLAGYICGNTTTTRDRLRTGKSQIEQIGNGGMSGAPLRQLSFNLCKRVARLKTKSQQIIAVGGITTGADAYEFIRAGASAIEVYTALIYKGPSLPLLICRELSALLKRDGLSLQDATGVDIK